MQASNFELPSTQTKVLIWLFKDVIYLPIYQEVINPANITHNMAMQRNKHNLLTLPIYEVGVPTLKVTIMLHILKPVKFISIRQSERRQIFGTRLLNKMYMNTSLCIQYKYKNK